MKTHFITFIALLLFIHQSIAATAPLPDIPKPSLSPDKVLAIMKAHLGKDAGRYTVVAVDWCVASQFQPRYHDGSTYSPAGDQPDGYSWFVTFLYHDDHQSKPAQPLNAVMVLRIKDDGSVGILVSVRT